MIFSSSPKEFRWPIGNFKIIGEKSEWLRSGRLRRRHTIVMPKIVLSKVSNEMEVTNILSKKSFQIQSDWKRFEIWNINLNNSEWKCFVVILIWTENPQAAKILLEAGANPNTYGENKLFNYKKPALHTAFKNSMFVLSSKSIQTNILLNG